MTRCFASWSGGKDSCLALYRAASAGMEIGALLNMVTADGRRSRSHGIDAAVIRKQAEAIGLPIRQVRTAAKDYEERFVAALERFREEGLTCGIFGDIDFAPHREWIEKVCARCGIVPCLPLWGEDQRKVLAEFIGAGFEAIVIAARKDIFDIAVPGSKLDGEFLAALTKMGEKVTPCGEAGEYHTLVIDGPIFRKRLEITRTERVTRGQHHLLKIGSLKLKARKKTI